MTNYRYTMYRDRLELTQQLSYIIKKELEKDSVSTHPGRTVLLAARTIIIPEGITFELNDCDLVLIADKHDTTKSTIKINVTDMPANGQPGLPGRKVTIVCQEFKGTNVLLQGGNGGVALTGAAGAQGQNGKPIIGEVDGADGKKGGKGGKGGNGGQGGDLSVTFFKDSTSGGIGNLTNINLPGGIGASGGEGGPGGRGGIGSAWYKGSQLMIQGTNGNTGPKGDTGTHGATGLNGSQKCTQLAAVDEFWQSVQSLSIPGNQWADYRFQSGEYFFRAFNAENPSYLKLAYNEFESVLFLDPQNTKAANYKNQILNNENIFGLSRELDIIPEFDRYEDVYTSYHPIITSIFDSATKMLDTNVVLSEKQQDLQREISNFSGVTNALKDEINAAKMGKEIAVKETDLANQRLDGITKQIADKKEELENASVNILGAVIGTVGPVASLAAAIPTGGMSLITAASSIAALAGIVKSAGAVEIIGEAFKPEEERTTINELEKEAKGLKGYVNDVVKGVKTAISFPKALEELWTADIDDEGYRKLIADSIEIAYQQLSAEMRQTQAEYTVQAAVKSLAQAKVNKENAANQLDDLQNDIHYLEQVSLSLIKMAQYYMNILTKYAFYGARTLEIYALKNKSREIRYDYGYIHPDNEANYKAGLLPLVNLIGLYHTSWSNFADLITYRVQYDNYFSTGDWVSDYHRISFTDDNILQSFKKKPELNFTIKIKDLPKTRYEAKVTSVYIAFIGAASKSNTIASIIEHSGRYSEKKRNNTVVNVMLKPRSAVVMAKTTPLESSGGVVVIPGITADFSGKGVAAGWHLYIEDSEIKKGEVNFDNLTEIQIWFDYQSFLLQSPSAAGSKDIKDGMMLQDPVSKALYVTSGNTKFPVSNSKSGLKETNGNYEEESIIFSGLSTIPKDDTLIREANSDKLYLIKKGLKLEVNDTALLDKLGLNSSDAKVVPDNGLSLLPFGGIAK